MKCARCASSPCDTVCKRCGVAACSQKCQRVLGCDACKAPAPATATLAADVSPEALSTALLDIQLSNSVSNALSEVVVDMDDAMFRRFVVQFQTPKFIEDLQNTLFQKAKDRFVDRINEYADEDIVVAHTSAIKETPETLAQLDTTAWSDAGGRTNSLRWVSKDDNIVLVGVKGDGTCLLHAIMRALNLKILDSNKFRESIAVDISSTRQGLGRDADVQRLIEELTTEDEWLLDSEPLCAYIGREFGVQIVTLSLQADEANKYIVSNVCTNAAAVDVDVARRLICLSNRDGAHYEVIGEMRTTFADREQRYVSMLMRPCTPYLASLFDAYYAQLDPELVGVHTQRNAWNALCGRA